MHITSYTDDNVQALETIAAAAPAEEHVALRAQPDVSAQPTISAQSVTSTRIAYLLSQYPAISHTFFLHEVLGLRALGLSIQTASINLPDRPMDALPPTEAAEAQKTLYIKSGSKPQMLLALCRACLASPGALWRGLFAVAGIPGLTLAKRLLWLFYLAEAMLVGHWMRQQRLSHLHVHFGGPAASVAMLTARAWQVPFSMTIHGPEELLNHEAYHLREKLAAASFVIAISDFCRSQLCQLMPPAQWPKINVVRLGVDPDVLTPVTPTPHAAVKLVSTGRMAPQKGHRILLEALHLLRDRGHVLQTTIIGGGADLKALQQYVTDHELSSSVIFTGPLAHHETLAHVASADVFALASFGEGIPVALMEAMAMAVPCVSTTVAGIPELIASGTDGLLVPPANVEAFATALESLILNPALRRQLGQAARQRIETTYNLPLNHHLLAQTFTRELATRSAPRGGKP